MYIGQYASPRKVVFGFLSVRVSLSAHPHALEPRLQRLLLFFGRGLFLPARAAKSAERSFLRTK